MYTSTEVLGNCSRKMTEENASVMTLEISFERRSGPGRFRSETPNGAMLYRHCTRARVGFCRWRGWASRGPYTAASTLFPPHSTYAEPSARWRTPASIFTGRSSCGMRPSFLRPSLSISLTFFSVSPMLSRLPSVLLLQETVDHLREPDRLGVLLDEPHRVLRDARVVRFAVDPDAAVLPHEDPAAREVLDQGDHAPLLPDDPGDLGGRDLDERAALELAQPFAVQGDLDAAVLVDGEDLHEEHLADAQEALGVPVVHPPRRLDGVERGRVGGVDVEQPVAVTVVRDRTDDGVSRTRHVPAGEGDDRDDPVPLVPDA